ncbi:MAG: hypothetical protein HDS52_09955, partial [Barnesiella sp.]|nr:hypothetical protein [Barnesiella sp.]
LYTPVRKEDGTIEKIEVGWPEHDWTARLFTSIGLNTYIVSRKGDVLTNCFNDNGRIHVVCNNHKLGKGRLQVEFHSEIPNAIYPDGIEDLYEPQRLDIELVDGPADCATTAEVEVMMPYIKGDKGKAFTYADFTPAQIAELQRPATEKVAEVTQALTRVETKEREITAAETLRQEDETQRSTAEQERAKQFTTLKQSIETATTDANTAAGSATTAANNAVAAANKANTAAKYAEKVSANIGQAKIALFDDMWASIGGTKLDNGNYRKTAAGKELTLAEAIVRYERNPFIVRWNELGKGYGIYNEQTCLFELNGLTDITYEEAIKIYALYPLCEAAFSTKAYLFPSIKVRTLFPIRVVGSIDMTAMFQTSALSKIRFIFNSTASIAKLTNIFYYADKLESIYGEITLGDSGSTSYTGAFNGCTKLRDIQLKKLKYSISFSHSPDLSVESLIYMVTNSVNTSQITITIHRNAYARVTDELFTLAEERNITLAAA